MTPAQHSALRRQVALVPIYVWLVYAGQIFLQQLPHGTPGPDTRVFRDFAHFYVLGVIANARDAAALYSMEAQDAIVARVVPVLLDTHFPPSYGPQVSVFFAPLARLPYLTALHVWLATTVAVYLACGYLVWRACPRLREYRWTVFVLLLASPALHFDLSFAQTSAFGLACFTAAFLSLRAERPFLAGLAIGSLIYKPQLGLAAAFVFVLAREWRVVLGAIAAAAIQIGVGVAYWGPSVLAEYARALGNLPRVMALIEPEKQQMHSWRPFFQLLGLSPDVVLWATVCASILTVIAAWVCWRARAPLAIRFAVMLLATVLVNPHMYVYDFLVLTPIFLLLWDWSLEQEPRFRLPFLGLLGLCAASPLLGPVSQASHVQVSVVALAVLGVVLLGRGEAVPEPRYRPVDEL